MTIIRYSPIFGIIITSRNIRPATLLYMARALVVTLSDIGNVISQASSYIRGTPAVTKVLPAITVIHTCTAITWQWKP